MAVDFDFSDVDAAFDEFYEEAKEAMIEVGEDAVQYAKDNGDYQDHTGTLRKSNEYEVDETGLTLKNETEYASYVEAKGFEVLSGAALEAEKRLNDSNRRHRNYFGSGLEAVWYPYLQEGRNTGRGSYRRKDNRYPERTQTGNLLD